MRKLNVAIILPALAVLLSTSLSFGGIILETAKWKKNKINVCWRSDNSIPLPQELEVQDWSDYPLSDFVRIVSPPKWLRDFVKQTITREYTGERVGIEFVGWNNCQANEPSDVQMVNVDGGTGWRNIFGQSYVGTDATISAVEAIGKRNRPKQPYIEIQANWLDPSKYQTDANGELFWALLARTAIHEFGHLSGLLHEHQPDKVSFPSGGSRRVSVQDPQSIMGTSSGIGRMDQGLMPLATLSAGDRHALRCLYFYSESTKLEKCSPSYQPSAEDI